MLIVLFFPLLLQGVRGDPCDAEFSCASCTEVKICTNTSAGYKELLRFTCPTSAPYCNSSGDCSYSPTLGCGPTDTFPCMRDGVFPDPTSCTKYRVCQNGTSYNYNCPSYYSFDSNQGQCVSGAHCYTISCSGKTGVKVPYGNDASIYAYCRDGVAVLVDRCPGPYKLDANTQMCGPVCKSTGNKIPDLTDCTKYFYCSKEPFAYSFTVTSLQCPDFYGFDPRGLRCVPLEMLPSCVPSETV